MPKTRLTVAKPSRSRGRHAEPMRFMAVGDAHYGVTRRYVHGQPCYEVPSHAPEAIAPLLEFAADFKPHVFAQMGDMVDCLPVSRHAINKPRELEGQRLAEDIERYETEFLKPLERALMPPAGLHDDDAVRRWPERYDPRKCLRLWLDGNHEAWADTLAAAHPGITGLVEPREVLRLVKRGWNVRPQGHLLRLGHWKAAHGDVILRYNGGSPSQYPAMKALTSYGSSIRIWHTHQKQYIMRPVMADESYHSAVCVPGLCSRAPGYLKNAPNRYMHGFCWGYIFDDGFFDDVIQVIWQGRFVANGKVYGQRRAA